MSTIIDFAAARAARLPSDPDPEPEASPSRPPLPCDGYKVRRSPPTGMSLAEYAIQHLGECRRRGDKSAHQRASTYAHIPRWFGDIRVTDLTREDVINWLAWVQVEYLQPDGRTYAPNTIRVWLSHLSVLLSSLDENPAARLPHGERPAPKTLPTYDAEGRTLTLRDAIRLLSSDAIPLERRVFYAVMIFCGPRVGEACNLRWRHWQRSRCPLGGLRFESQWSATRGEDETKTGDAHTAPVHDELAILLHDWQEASPFPTGPDDLIFPRRYKGEILPRARTTIRTHLLADLAALGLERRGPHALRHTFLTLATEEGNADEGVIFAITHRPSSRDIRDVYRHRSWKRACEEVAKHPVRLVRSMTQLGLDLGDAP